MSEHENGNFVLKCGQNQQKYQSFMAISDFALLYRIRRCAARSQLLSFSIPPVVFLENMVSIRKRGEGMQSRRLVLFPWKHGAPFTGRAAKARKTAPAPPELRCGPWPLFPKTMLKRLPF